MGLGFTIGYTWRGRVISRVTSTLNGVTPIITLLINDLLSPLALQVGDSVWGLAESQVRIGLDLYPELTENCIQILRFRVKGSRV